MPYYIFLINIQVQVIDVSWWWCWLGGRGGLQYIISSAVWNINLLSIFNKIIIIWSIFCLKNKVYCMNLIERRKSAMNFIQTTLFRKTHAGVLKGTNFQILRGRKLGTTLLKASWPNEKNTSRKVTASRQTWQRYVGYFLLGCIHA